MLAHHEVVAICLFKFRNITALEVFDDLRLEHLPRCERADQGGDLGKPRENRGAVAALASDDLVQRALVAPLWSVVLVRPGPHEDGLHHALLADRGGQVGEVSRVERLARVGGARRQVGELDVAEGGLGGHGHTPFLCCSVHCTFASQRTRS